MKFIKFYLILVAIILSPLAYSQVGSGSVGITNCYQRFNFDGASSDFNMLTFPDVIFRFFQPEGVFPYAFTIIPYDENGVEIPGYDYSGLYSAEFQFTSFYYGEEGEEEYFIAVKGGYLDGNDDWVPNLNWFDFDPEVKSFTVIEWYTDNQNGGSGSPQLFQGPISTVHLKTVEEAFSMEPETESCYTFDDFEANLTHILDGLCNNIHATLNIVEPVPAGSGWSSSFSHSLPDNLDGSTNVPTPSSPDWCYMECVYNPPMTPPGAPDPVPCGCVNFTVDFTLTPCMEVSASCPNFEFSKEIEVCCDCDARPQGPSN